jgi:universal stress protein E
MSQYRNILVVVSPDMRRTPAIDRAIVLARSTGAVLDLCLFDRIVAVDAIRYLHPEVAALAQRAWRAEREDWLADQCEHLRDLQITATFRAVWGTEDHQLAAILDKHPCDLVVRDLGVTAVDRRILRSCTAPLLLVHPRDAQIRRVVAAVDPVRSDTSQVGLNERILGAALGLSLQCDAQPRVVAVFAGLSAAPPVVSLTDDAMFAAAWGSTRESLQEKFIDLTGKHGVAVHQRYFLTGDAATLLTSFAVDHAADVLVIGASQRGVLERLTVGSTAERIVECAPCDVLVVRP